jgi:hypothetical protein
LDDEGLLKVQPVGYVYRFFVAEDVSRSVLRYLDEMHSRTQARRISIVVGMVMLSVVGSWGAPAHAKLKPSEKPFLRTFLEGTFGRPASASTVSCMNSRLSAGTMEDLSVDALFAEDPAELADSIPFRRVFRILFGCQPVEFVATLGNSLSSSRTTRTQRNCMGRGFAKRISADEDLLTIMIRSGVNDTEFADLTEDQRITVAANLAVVFRRCLPRSTANDQIDELILELLS